MVHIGNNSLLNFYGGTSSVNFIRIYPYAKDKYVRTDGWKIRFYHTKTRYIRIKIESSALIIPVSFVCSEWWINKKNRFNTIKMEKTRKKIIRDHRGYII